MTIEVRITNKDKERQIEVLRQDLSRENGKIGIGPVRIETLKPGESCTHYCHLLSELIVRERDPLLYYAELREATVPTPPHHPHPRRRSHE